MTDEQMLGDPVLGGSCWFCYWGWPEPIRAIYNRACADAEIGDMALDYGPGHIVWADENFATGHIEWCIREAQKYRDDLSDPDFAVALRALTELLAVPESIRNCQPPNYDGEYPEKFPPPRNLRCAPKGS